MAKRGEKLGVEVLQGIEDKASALDKWVTDNELDLEQVAYLGNDVNDAPALERVGWPVVVGNAHPDIKAISRVALRASGGEGAVRELADMIISGLKDGDD